MRVIKFLSVVLIMSCCGCAWYQPGSDSMSSIVVEGCSVRDVRKMTKSVFWEQSYLLTSQADGNISFERAGTMDDRFRYARYQESMTMQVELFFEDYNGGCLIRANAYALRSGSRVKQKVLKIARRPYQKLLKEVRDRCEEAEDK